VTLWHERCRLPLLDGFDADVMLCPSHEWVTEDRTPPGREQGDPWYLVAVCLNCHGTRCGHLGDSNPCLRARHHTLEPHRYKDGTTAPIGA
jgi:hypothetical protein